MWFLSDLEQANTDIAQYCAGAAPEALDIPFAGVFLSFVLEHLSDFFSSAATTIHYLDQWADVMAAASLDWLSWTEIKQKIEDAWGLTILLFSHGSAIEDHEERIYKIETAPEWVPVAPEAPEDLPPWYAKILGFPLDLTSWLFTSIVERLEGFLEDRVDWVFEVGRRVLIKLI